MAENRHPLILTSLILHLPRESGKLPQVIAVVGCATKNHIAIVLTAAKNLT